MMVKNIKWWGFSFLYGCILRMQSSERLSEDEIVVSSEMLVPVCWTTWHQIPEDSNLNIKLYHVLKIQSQSSLYLCHVGIRGE